ncbi:lysophospholipid acyltransferase family protein [Vibrio vulnificus]|nr:lysophospholipid acyltransferase family protein [Vibrio vulnificus]ELM6616004.1 lysophospholipid acyltransferase family protein [Vibrio vulnificus]ELM6618959.1 lysophospholipid acyltransferase family protein [Vibrio vulnificus]ELP3502955.1 lysophospholipid acyltransferase family protein [Vibrio vulnificus]ELP3551756.1 lysophospholipid acyltransferase family protein [Vibrio vulnificus]
MAINSPFRLPRKTPFGIGENVAEWMTGLSKLDKFYAQRPPQCDTQTFLRFTLEVLGIDYQIVKGSLDNVPQIGPTVVVANHPLGCVEGVILAELLLMMREDVQILANQYLKTVPELDTLFIGVDVFDSQQAAKSNMKALRDTNKHLAQGGLLLVFPAGEVSQLVDRKQKRLEDKEWSRSVSALIRRHKAHALPVFIDGQNSQHFYLAGKIHPLLRTLMLGRELLNKKQQAIPIAIGQPIKFKEVQHLTDEQLVSYLRLNTYLLSAEPPLNHRMDHDTNPPLAAIAEPLEKQKWLLDLAMLPEDALLLRQGNFSVYCTTAKYIPSILHEIGRQREINFRAVGEGTGYAIDIDRFDHHYHHLFVWDDENQHLVGSYRLGLVDKLLEKSGLDGLYSRTLFDYDAPFLTQLGQSIEMGRSVITSPYQRSMNALLLLWKGIATFVSQHPQYTHLFGPVSISNDYSPTARQLLAQSMTLHHYDAASAELVKPLNPIPDHHPKWNTSMLTALGDLQLLSRVISRIDEGKGVPVLLRQYLGLNGKLVCFNVDPAFNNALDGMIVVDLRDVPEKTLGKYMTPAKARHYLSLHQV